MEGVENFVFWVLVAAIVITWFIAIFKGFRNKVSDGLSLLLLGPLGAVFMLYNSSDIRVQSACKQHLFSILGIFVVSIGWGVISS